MVAKETNALLEFLKGTELFADFKKEELISLLPYLHGQTFEKGQWLFHEGDEGRSLYLIKEGKAEIFKKEPEFGTLQSLGQLEAGDWVGEMAFLEQKKRSASVQATEPLEVIVVSLEEIYATPLKALMDFKLGGRLIKRMSSSLRRTNERLIVFLKEQLKLLQIHEEVGLALVFFSILISVFFNVAKFLDNYYTGPERAQAFIIFYPVSIVIFGVCALILMCRSPSSLSFYGVSLKRFWKNAGEAAFWTLPFLLVMLWLKWFAINYLPSFQQFPLFITGARAQVLLPGTIFYIILVPFQELTARCFLQSCLQEFFRGPRRIFFAILASNLMFAVIHTPAHIFLFAFSFLFGLVWGYLFYRQRSIVGVSVSHILVGIWGFNVIDFQGVFPV